MERRKKFLVAPLDWGLGHATRCIPIINELLSNNCEVILASNGNALALLKEEFPDLNTFELPGYNPVYPASGNMVFKMALQLPKFLKTILREHLEIEKIIAQNNVDVVISDNRYGCFSKHIKSVFITHQVNILLPNTIKWLEKRLNHFNHEQIKQYAECWVPAPPDSFIPGLIVNHQDLKIRYLGYLSRFSKLNSPKKNDILVICSGPEPQRTIFENMMGEQLKKGSMKYLIVKGLPGLKNEHNSHNEISFMNSQELNTAIESSRIVIARPGYTTVMDLAKLGSKAIFIPTPSQTEQEYIAAELSKSGIAFSIKQSDFNLETALKESVKFTGFPNSSQDNVLLKTAIQSLL